MTAEVCVRTRARARARRAAALSAHAAGVAAVHARSHGRASRVSRNGIIMMIIVRCARALRVCGLRLAVVHEGTISRESEPTARATSSPTPRQPCAATTCKSGEARQAGSRTAQRKVVERRRRARRGHRPQRRGPNRASGEIEKVRELGAW
jgi:hypothetical protein